ncbi:hypothetical protein [Tenacibaculum piscium]|uniref:hypothetical protein n=1 Tax=Tenacibaculum piscium TaxID=1458515 RepID=UPI001F167F01|nr:hypothetical protein [Tenacibaculum piscium]
MKKIILILLVINISCKNINRLKKDETKIKKFLISKKKEKFNLILDTISSFEWDELLVAGPYMDLNKISGYYLNEIPNTIKSHDSFILYCFIKNKRGIKYIELERHLFSDKVFEKKILNRIYKKNESNFLITKK